MLGAQKHPLRIAGFTLVEMMVVMAVLSILLAIAAPSLQIFMRNAQLRSVSESLLVGINLARSEAIRRNTQVSFWIVTNVSASCALTNRGGAWVVSQDNPAGSCDVAASLTAGPRIVQTHSGNDAMNGINVTAADSGGTPASCITFNGFGGAEANCTGSLTSLKVINLDSEAGTRPLRIAVSGGSARLCDPSINDDTNPASCPM